MTEIPIPEALLTEVPPPSWTLPRHEAVVREFSQLPVTALCFTSSRSQIFLLAAEDTSIKIYDVATSEVIADVPVFEEQTVHGISVSGLSVLVWGNKQVAYFQLDGLENTKGGFLPEVSRVGAPDWVYDGKISPHDPTLAVLATAHNEVVRLRISLDSSRLSVEEVISPARPNLYSAELSWLDDSSVLMAAGTAFGEILVWKYTFSDTKGEYEMLFVFTGHEGSIYGIAISSPLILPGSKEERRLLASCSDDRTVRIWDITPQSTKQSYDFVTARETGFSELLPNAEKTPEGREPVAMAMGHLSRIWGVEIGDVNEKGDVDIWTFGEDSTAWRWKLSLQKEGERLRGSLQGEKTMGYHEGKHLWAHASMRDGGKTWLATGGADGRITLVETKPKSGQASEMITLDCQDLDSNSISEEGVLLNNTVPAPKRASKKKPEVLGRFAFISQDQILVTTSTGRLLLGTYTKDDLEWQTILPEHDVFNHEAEGHGLEHNLKEEIKQCYVLKAISDGTAAVGTTSGNVYLYNNCNVHLVQSFPKKVVDITVLAFHDDDTTAEVLIHIFGTACPTYMRVNTREGRVIEHHELTGLDERFICTSATLLSPYIVMGSRHGWLSVLQRNQGTYTQVLTYQSPTCDTITSMVPLPTSPDTEPTLFLCTSRDGSYRIFSLTPDHQIILIHHASLAFGPMIESAFFTTHSPPHLIITGFRSKNFIVWNETLREERLSVDCGGAHRSFSFWHDATGEGVMRFTFNRASKLSVHSQSTLQAKPLKRGTHGREIRSVAESMTGFNATAGEDTTIKICRDHPEKQCLASLRAHVSGLQKVKWLNGIGDFRGDMLFSSAGNEEFFVWRVTPLEGTSYEGLGVLQEAVFDDKSPDGDLRIMDFDLQQTFHALTQGYLSEDRTAVVGGSLEPDGGVIIIMAFSNSVLARYKYHPDHGFTLLAKGTYTGACLTQIKHLGPLPGNETEEAVLTASTDGHLAIWRSNLANKTFTIIHTLKVHQSSIKCLDVKSSLGRLHDTSPQATRYITTGGDDNALGITLLTPDLLLKPHGIVRHAHAAAINALSLRIWHRDQEGQMLQILTVSNDQRFKTWELRIGGVDGRVRLRRDAYSGVADPGDLMDACGRVVLVGVGVEVWREGEER